jgi:hypothetical protein
VFELLEIVGAWFLGKVQHRPRLAARLAGFAAVTVVAGTAVFLVVLLAVLLR